MPAETQLSYYQGKNFNPVPINLETPAAWKSHRDKRRNLYEMHLGIPLSLLKGRDVLEFGCNSGENALVLASFGANLTLVEPNHQVFQRLESLFTKFDLKAQISSLINTDIDRFCVDRTYDVVLAEGFLYNLQNRDLLLARICDLLAPGGLGVISFLDRYGTLVEWTKQLLLWRTCYLSGVSDPQSEDCLNLARKLYADDFAQIAASRPFKAWWQDSLIWTNHNLWSYQEIIPLIQGAGCEFFSTSPKWETVDHFNWYKNVYTPSERHLSLMESWGHAFPFFLTGALPSNGDIPLPSPEVLKAVSKFVAEISEYTSPQVSSSGIPEFPAQLHEYLDKFMDPCITRFNADMERLYKAAAGNDLDTLVDTYHHCDVFRKRWGSPYHYICFIKPA